MTVALVEVCPVDTTLDAEAYNRIGAMGVTTAIANALVGEPMNPAPEMLALIVKTDREGGLPSGILIGR